jgi:hypothetical protein
LIFLNIRDYKIYLSIHQIKGYGAAYVKTSAEGILADTKEQSRNEGHFAQQ